MDGAQQHGPRSGDTNMVANAPAKSRRGGASILRNVFTSGKKLAMRPSTVAQGKPPVPESRSQGVKPLPSVPRTEVQSFTAGPEYAPTVLEARKSVQKVLPPVTSQTLIISAKKPKSGSLSIGRRFRWKKPAGLLKEGASEYDETARKIESRSWCPDLNMKSSSFSLGDMAKSETLSPAAKNILKAGSSDFKEFKKKESEKRRKEEQEKKKQTEVEQTCEVIETRIVQQGPEEHVRIQRLRSSISCSTLRRPLDPRAHPPIPTVPSSSRASIYGESSVASGWGLGQTIGSDSGSVVARPRGVSRKPSDQSLFLLRASMDYKRRIDQLQESIQPQPNHINHTVHATEPVVSKPRERTQESSQPPSNPINPKAQATETVISKPSERTQESKQEDTGDKKDSLRGSDDDEVDN